MTQVIFLYFLYFGMSIILVLSMSQVARDIMRRSLSKRSAMYAVGSETYLRPFPRIGALTRTRSNEGEKTPPRQFSPPVIGLIFFVYIDPAIAELGIRCPITKLPSPRARRVPPPITR